MMDPVTAVQEFSDTCIRCGLCARTDCGNYAEGTPNLGDICESLLSGEEAWQHFPFTCALCNRCTVKCPVGLNAADACKPLRGMLLPARPDLVGLYRHFRTDYKHNLFSLLRSKHYGTGDDVTYIDGELGVGDEADACAFFPGCSLFSYSPELVERTSQWLRDERIAARTLYFCCGACFYDSGFYEQFAAYREKVQAFLAQQGIKRLVVACPHCNHILPDVLEGTGIEILKLPELMVEHGMRAPESCKVSFHDACYDRETGAFGIAARKLYEDAELLPLEHERERTYCCGSGGMVSAYAPAYCEYRRNQRLAQIDASGTDEVVSTCFSCVNSMQRGDNTVPVKHYLESVFGIDVDWGQVYANVNDVYADPHAMELLVGEELTFE